MARYGGKLSLSHNDNTLEMATEKPHDPASLRKSKRRKLVIYYRTFLISLITVLLIYPTVVTSVALKRDECATCADNSHEEATCTNTRGSFTSECNDGYNGDVTNCTDIDKCVSGPCINGQCVSGVNRYTCDCSPGWSGVNCKVEIDECSNNNRCLNDATCVSGLNQFTCRCAPGWKGNFCQFNIDDCYKNKKCLNGAICMDGINQFTCRCNPGWTGTFCQIMANEEGTLAETTITCPHSFETVFELGSSKTVTWPEPAYLADSLASRVERSHSQGAEFCDGVTWVTYTFKDAYDNIATCNFSITVLEVDTTPPTIVLCPSDVTVTKITNLLLTVAWEPPVATDLSESVSLVSQNHFPGDEFEFGVNNVTYKFTDDSGNNAVCFFRIYVIEVNNNISSLFNVDESRKIAAFEAYKAYEAHDAVINEFRGTEDKFHGLINGLYIFLGFVGLVLALLLLFVIKLLRKKTSSGVGKPSYIRMNGDAEVDTGI